MNMESTYNIVKMLEAEWGRSYQQKNYLKLLLENIRIRLIGIVSSGTKNCRKSLFVKFRIGLVGKNITIPTTIRRLYSRMMILNKTIITLDWQIPNQRK
jgi:hypothetical protein